MTNKGSKLVIEANIFFSFDCFAEFFLRVFFKIIVIGFKVQIVTSYFNVIGFKIQFIIWNKVDFRKFFILDRHIVVSF